MNEENQYKRKTKQLEYGTVSLLVHKTQYYVKTETILHIEFAIKPDGFIAGSETANHKDNTNIKNSHRQNT